MEKQVEENERLHIQLTNRIKDQLNTKKQEIEFARVEFQNDKTELENNIVTLTNYRERDAEKIKHLNEKLLSYKELEREAIIQELGTPKEVLIHLDLLKQQLKEVRSKLQGRTEDDLEEELEFYKEKAEELEDEISSLKQKYDEVRQRENKYKLSVREKLELQKQNDLLETSNSALTHSIDSIRSQLDDLIEKQQSQEAFRELLKMDREYNEKIPVQTVSSLKEFTEELQHRIAKSTRTELYYDLGWL
jgi:DNA repair exonuclease SbcCD ATPase subunit